MQQQAAAGALQGRAAALQGRAGLHIAHLCPLPSFPLCSFVRWVLTHEGGVEQTAEALQRQPGIPSRTQPGLLPWLRAQGLDVKRLHVWTDGSSNQFRCCDKHWWQSELGLPCTWNHWQAGHGKGEHDGVGTHIKAAARREQARQGGVRIDSAHTFFEFCAARLSAPALEHSAAKAAATSTVERRFVWVPVPGEAGAVKRREGAYKSHVGTSTLAQLAAQQRQRRRRPLACR